MKNIDRLTLQLEVLVVDQDHPEVIRMMSSVYVIHQMQSVGRRIIVNHIVRMDVVIAQGVSAAVYILDITMITGSI
jgi:uncharacterized protein YaiI (UPF0178 family)